MERNSKFHPKWSIKIPLCDLWGIISDWDLMDQIAPLLYMCTGARVLKNKQFNVYMWQKAEMQVTIGLFRFSPVICQQTHTWPCQNLSVPARDPNARCFWSVLNTWWVYVSCCIICRACPILPGRAGFTLQDARDTIAQHHLNRHRAARGSTVAVMNTKQV